MSEQSTRGNVVAFQKSADFLRECAARNQRSDLLRALDFLHRALELEPGNADILMEEAELLNEMDCPYESTLALGRAVSGGRVPREACFGLASNLVSMGLLDPAICALRLYLAENAQGENARSARELLSLTQLGVEARFQSRRTRRASRLCAGAIRLMRAGRYERARLLVQRELDGRLLVCLPLQERRLTRRFSLILHKHKYLSPSLEAFLDVCGAGQ